MNKTLPPRIQFNIVDDDMISNPGETYIDEESEEDYESYEDEIRSKMPEIVEKPKPVKEDIFDLPNLAVRPDYLDDYLEVKELSDEETPDASLGAPRKKPKQIETAPEAGKTAAAYIVINVPNILTWIKEKYNTIKGK